MVLLMVIITMIMAWTYDITGDAYDNQRICMSDRMKKLKKDILAFLLLNRWTHNVKGYII